MVGWLNDSVDVWLRVFRILKPGFRGRGRSVISCSDSLESPSGHRGYLPLSVVEPEPPSPKFGPQTSLQVVTDSSWNWTNSWCAGSYRTAFVISCLVKRRFINCMGKTESCRRMVA
jgi:hypothetical protein